MMVTDEEERRARTRKAGRGAEWKQHGPGQRSSGSPLSRGSQPFQRQCGSTSPLATLGLRRQAEGRGWNGDNRASWHCVGRGDLWTGERRRLRERQEGGLIRACREVAGRDRTRRGQLAQQWLSCPSLS